MNLFRQCILEGILAQHSLLEIVLPSLLFIWFERTLIRTHSLSQAKLMQIFVKENNLSLTSRHLPCAGASLSLWNSINIMYYSSSLYPFPTMWLLQVTSKLPQNRASCLRMSIPVKEIKSIGSLHSMFFSLSHNFFLSLFLGTIVCHNMMWICYIISYLLIRMVAIWHCFRSDFKLRLLLYTVQSPQGSSPNESHITWLTMYIPVFLTDLLLFTFSWFTTMI